MLIALRSARRCYSRTQSPAISRIYYRIEFWSR